MLTTLHLQDSLMHTEQQAIFVYRSHMEWSMSTPPPYSTTLKHDNSGERGLRYWHGSIRWVSKKNLSEPGQYQRDSLGHREYLFCKINKNVCRRWRWRWREWMFNCNSVKHLITLLLSMRTKAGSPHLFKPILFTWPETKWMCWQVAIKSFV